MFATTAVRFALVAAALSSLTNAAPLFNFGRKEAVAMVRRAQNGGQLAQGTNFYFTTLHLEDACSPGQVACVSGNYATCSGEGNWEITPCTSGTTCLATPASSPSGISIQCTSQETAQSSIQNAGGNPNTLVADFHVTDAPFSADTVASSSSSAPASTATESSSAPADTASSTASPTDAPTESASATESSASSTCTPDDEEDDGTIADSSTSTASPTATETVDPSSTCTEEPVETETITVIVVPVPSSTGVYSTTTLFPEQPEPTVVGTDVPVPTESSTDVSSSTESSSESVPTESSSSSEEPSYTEPAPTESSSSSSSVPTESSSSSEAPAPTESSSSSESVMTVTTIFVDPGLSIPALPTGTGGASTPVAIPVVSVVGTHTVPAKRMVRVIRRA
ncbi:SubName: Full=Related to cell surface flocculin-Saccharomyces cerevisiae {ECO:0000313/EMBL:CCA70272.1} [Serendipita indica DSM 11827]|nr:SubName: Full=Related to cell surface flocculin-Saccharomyces cerevisiae {ECO:0000313/EMBL:CCA70272.1} [Serendipita indica DSM 11827]